MALRVTVSDGDSLVEKIKDSIKKKEVVTWSCDSDGDFTHTPEQWKDLAWLRPNVTKSEVIFNILGSTDTWMSKETYAVYHGRFAEMLLSHFDLDFEACHITAIQTDDDNLGSLKNSPDS